ncbi:MAG: resolvase [Burkholderiaceae bacterium]|nr:resolvase [Burkholderiaceae bacterium]
MFVRAYLRASTDEQDANRARQQLQQFANERGLTIAAYYVENESGASLKRPELFRLLNDCQHGDMLLIEQVDRLSRLNDADWECLKSEIQARGVRIVALDLPTSWASVNADETTSRIMQAVNNMLLDMLAAIARKDYTDRRRRQAQGIAKAQAEGAYKGRKPDEARNAAIIGMLSRGEKWTAILDATGCSRSTLSRLSKKIKCR